MFDPATHPSPLPTEPFPEVVVLAGGLGTRLKATVPDRPKPIAKVGGRPFLEWWMESLQTQGIQRVTLCTGHGAAQVRDLIGTRWQGMEVAYSHEESPRGTGGALALAASRVAGNWILALNGDSFCEIDLALFWARHREREAETTLAVARVGDTRRFGVVTFEADGKVTSFAEKSSLKGEGWINAGIYLLSRELLLNTADGRNISLEKDLLPAWIGRGLYAENRTRRFIDIGTPESFLEAQTFFTRAAAA